MAEADALFDRPVIHPLVAARELALAIGDETRSSTRRWPPPATCANFSTTARRASTPSCAAARSAGACRRRSASRWASGGPCRLAGRRRRRNVPPQALWTAVNERLPVTFVVINNREYNILKNFMRSQPHYTSAQTGRFVAMGDQRPADRFLALATAVAPLATHRAGRGYSSAGQRAVASNRPNLIEIVVAAE